MEFLDDNASVYFQLSEEYGKENIDSLSYSFAYNDLDRDTVFMQVKIIGNPANYDRFFNVVILDSLTSAKPNVHYEELELAYKVPADSIYGRIPIILNNSDHTLKDSVFQISLQLLESEDFQLGVKERLSAKLSFTDRLVQPSSWFVLRYFFGSYNRKKHEIFIQLYERDFPDDYMEVYNEFGLWQTYGKLTSQYFKDNYPVYDDDGAIVEPW
jgi:hypothetical protein